MEVVWSKFHGQLSRAKCKLVNYSVRSLHWSMGLGKCLALAILKRKFVTSASLTELWLTDDAPDSLFSAGRWRARITLRISTFSVNTLLKLISFFLKLKRKKERKKKIFNQLWMVKVTVDSIPNIFAKQIKVDLNKTFTVSDEQECRREGYAGLDVVLGWGYQSNSIFHFFF